MGFIEGLQYNWYDLADERTMNWPLIKSPYCVPSILLCYLYFVLKCGPRFMENRQQYKLKTYIKCYNIFQVVTNAMVIYAFIDAGWFTEIGIYCEPVKYTYERGSYQLAKTMWWVVLLKLTDLTETAVFILRKKSNQVSFLHVYHHVSTVLIQWLGTRYIGGGMSTFIVMVNSGVHVMMYTYYFLSTCGPSVQRVIAHWKPMITIIQMVQFVLLMIYTTQTFIPSCPTPRIPGMIFIANLLINLYLFYDFYRKSYSSPKTKKT